MDRRENPFLVGGGEPERRTGIDRRSGQDRRLRVRAAFGVEEEQLDALLDEMDQITQGPGREMRKADRFVWRSDNLMLYIDEGGEQACYRAPTRDISVGGLSFLHGYRIQPGQQIRLRFPDAPSTREVHARVCRCRHLEGRIYEIGVRYLSPGMGRALLEAFMKDGIVQRAD
jgi:hypothetical protein